MTITVLAGKGRSNNEIGRRLGVPEEAVCYHVRRASEGAEDVCELHGHLVEEWGYKGSYRSVLRYVRRQWARPAIGIWRRVEMPPGAQSQTDWAEYPSVAVGDGWERLSAFVMVLSHSRRLAIVLSRRQDQLSWLHCHKKSFRRLGGVVAVNRIDNVKTAVVSGSGPWGVIHPVYRAYARSVGFHIGACRAGQAHEKGKVEAKVRLSRLLIRPETRRWKSLQQLQALTDERDSR